MWWFFTRIHVEVYCWSVMETIFSHSHVSRRDVWCHMTSSLTWKLCVMIGRRRRKNIFTSNSHSWQKTTRKFYHINFFQLHHPHSGVSRDKSSQELQLMCFTPFSRNTYKWQLYTVKFAATWLLFCKKRLMEMQLLASLLPSFRFAPPVHPPVRRLRVAVPVLLCLDGRPRAVSAVSPYTDGWEVSRPFPKSSPSPTFRRFIQRNCRRWWVGG